MLSIKRILFPTDYSRCSDQALLHALALAEHSNSELHIIHAVLPLELNDDSLEHHQPDFGTLQTEVDRLSSRQVETAAGLRSYKDLVIKQRTVRGISAGQAILEYASSEDIDLIVMGTHGRRGLNHLMLGSVAEEVVRMALNPVLTIRESRTPVSIGHFNQILVPVDFSGFSRESLLLAGRVALEFGSTIRVLHVVEEIIHPSFYVTGQTSLASWYPEMEAHALGEMKRLVEGTLPPGVLVEYHIKEGKAAADISIFARKNNIDLIIMASHGLTGIEHLLLGSVSERVARLAPCPLLTIKAFGKSLLGMDSERVLGSGNPA